MFPHAVIEAGDLTPMKLVGEDWKVMDSNRGGAVVEDEVWVAVWYGSVAVVWVTN